MKVYLYEIKGGDSFISTQSDFSSAYLKYCITHKIVPQSVENYRAWETESRDQATCNAAEDSRGASLVISVDTAALVKVKT